MSAVGQEAYIYARASAGGEKWHMQRHKVCPAQTMLSDCLAGEARELTAAVFPSSHCPPPPSSSSSLLRLLLCCCYSPAGVRDRSTPGNFEKECLLTIGFRVCHFRDPSVRSLSVNRKFQSNLVSLPDRSDIWPGFGCKALLSLGV